MVGRAQVNKPHKTRFSSKSSRNLHTTVKDKRQINKSDRNGGKVSRAARIQKKKMQRGNKQAAAKNKKKVSSDPTSPPLVIVLFGLSGNVDLNSLERDLLEVLSPSTCSNEVFPTIVSSEYGMRATVLKAPHGDLSSCMEMVKVADLIAFVASASSPNEEGSSDYVDPFGEHCLSVFRNIGLPSTVVFIRDLPIDLKRRHEAKKFCISSLASEFSDECKFYSADTKDELRKFMGLFKDKSLESPKWRDQQSYVATQKLELLDHDIISGKCTLLLTGYLRARSLSVNQLVHVSGAGDYQLCKIEVLRDPFALNPRKGQDVMDADDVHDVQAIRSLIPDSSKQEPLLVENIPDPLAGEQTWPTEAEMAEAEEDRKQKKSKKRRLPRGTSEYQAAWILDNADEDDIGSIDEDNDGMVLDEEENGGPFHEASKNFDSDEDQDSVDLGDSDVDTETDSVMMDGEKVTREQIEDDIRRLKDAHAEDEDEVDTPLDIPARKRFAKYRGVKSFRTSSWDPKESLPPEYARIFAFENFARTRKHVFAKALELDKESGDDAVQPGTYLRLYVKEVPLSVASKLCVRVKAMPIITCGLLQHESKMSVLHFRLKKHDSYHEPIKGKEEMIFHVGFRQFVARPIFSSDNMNSDKHKMERFLHAGRISIASVYAPISFASLPLIAMKAGGDASSPVVAAVGSLTSVDPDKILLKKIILTGYPQRVSKVKAIVRYMFHHPEDVRWFKPVEVWSKCGRRGRIKEPVGTHGAMKCLFNGVLQQHDTVCMTLYKRSYPKWPEQKFPLLDS